MSAVARRTGAPAAPFPGSVILDYPFRGRWLVQNSPARRVPSHGTELFATRYAIDFVPVGPDGRSAPLTLRSWFAPEPPDRFVGFGRPILAPVAGTVVAVHDGEPDHGARRTLIPQVPYTLTQRDRLRRGAAGLAGNHVVLESVGAYVLLAHLRRGSVAAQVGQRVAVGEPVGECGNSGNSTEPHLHLQVTNSLDMSCAQPLPVAFRRVGANAVIPGEGEIVER